MKRMKKIMALMLVAIMMTDIAIIIIATSINAGSDYDDGYVCHHNRYQH